MAVWRRADGGGSGMGCLWLDEPGFPKNINDKLYTADWTSGKIFKFDMKLNKQLKIIVSISNIL